MALSPRSESDFKRKANEKLKTASDPVEKLRLRCLARGANGIRGLGRCFRIMDDDRSHSLNYNEFVTGIEDYGLVLPVEEKRELFSKFDRDGSGTIDFDEFLERLRPPISQRRMGLIGQAFAKLDRTGDGKVTPEDLKGVYSVKFHKKYANGEWSADRCQQEFLKSFEIRGNKDGVVTKDEFLNYYTAVSASIDNDPYFDLMMRNSFGLGE